MKRHNLLLLLTFFLITSCSAINQDRTVMIPVRDGTKLSTLLIFPKTNQKKYPVILIRSPYKKEIYTGYYNYLVENGYVLAIQDVRGRFGSEGKFEPFINESKDGYDAIEWIANQDWCDGNVGMVGASYNGWVQFCAAIEKPPHLRTIIPSCAPVDLFYNIPYHCGIFVPYILSLCDIFEEEATSDLTGKKIQEIYGKNWEKLLQHQPVSELDTKILSRKIDYYQKWILHDSKDNYWKQGCYLEKLKEIKIPVFIQSSWFDSQLINSKTAFNELIKSGNKNVKMIIGPWEHGDKESKYYQNKYMGEAADDINLQSQFVRWLNYWLKNEKNGIDKEPMIQLYALKSDKWYQGNTYPLKNTSDRKLFFGSSNKTLTVSSGGALLDSNEFKYGFDKYIYDPGDVPEYPKEIENNFSIIKDILINRKDYLFYKSASFERTTTIAGQLSAKIFAESSAFDTDWFIIVMALDKGDNFVDAISYGMLRAKFRNFLDKPELLERNKVYEFDIDLNHCCMTLGKGQKIGVIVTSSFMYPFFAKNLNTGRNSFTEIDYKIAEQKIYHTKEYSSYISIPVLNEGIKK